MSAETQFRALMAADAGLVAKVGTRIAQNAVPQGEAFPLVVFASRHDKTYGTDDTLLADEVTFITQCWDKDPTEADSVADLVAVAIGLRAELSSRSTAYNDEVDAHCVELTHLWFDV